MDSSYLTNNHWNSPIYQQTVLIVMCVIIFASVINFLLRKKNQYSMVAWASLKSWLIMAPVMFLIMGTPAPVPTIFLTLLAIYGAKVFFQIMGMFHRSAFVHICYAGIVGLGYAAYTDNLTLYNIMTMIVLGMSCLVPLFKKDYKNMIQCISLTLLAFIFLGWSFLHLGLVLNIGNGIYQVMYLIILTEFCDNTNLALSGYFRGEKFLPTLNSRRTIPSTVIAIFLTLLLAYGMRHLLPDRGDKYWLASGLLAAFGGLVGDLVMAVVRKDAGVKTVGPFIIGRGDFLQRMDRLIFVAPIYYFVMLALK